jgi:CubicO group peptidase (beta-lactamase class C family)
VPQRFGSADPAGGISTTALDMSRFMLALLGDGSLESGRLLSPASVATLLAAQYTPDPRIAPRGHAFKHWFTHRDGARNAQRVAGTCRDYRHARDDLTRLMALIRWTVAPLRVARQPPRLSM